MGELHGAGAGGCVSRPPGLIKGRGPSVPQCPPAPHVQPHARLPAVPAASPYPGSAMASSSVLMGRTSSAVSWASCHPSPVVGWPAGSALHGH